MCDGPSARVDAFIAGVDTRRLDADALEVAAAGPVHRAVATRFLLALVGNLDARPSGLHGPLDSLASITDPGTDIPSPARTKLDEIATRASRSGTAARLVLRSAASTA